MRRIIFLALISGSLLNLTSCDVKPETVIKAIDKNDPEGQFVLGLSCFKEENFEEGVEWFTKSAKQDHKLAQYELGCCYQYGKGVEKVDFEEASKWFTKSANQNFARAQFALGICYLKGQGIKQNSEEAVKWLKKATYQGLADAQCILGDCYLKGIGIEKNEEEGIKWLKKAADQNHAEAKSKLKQMGCN